MATKASPGCLTRLALHTHSHWPVPCFQNCEFGFVCLCYFVLPQDKMEEFNMDTDKEKERFVSPWDWGWTGEKLPLVGEISSPTQGISAGAWGGPWGAQGPPPPPHPQSPGFLALSCPLLTPQESLAHRGEPKTSTQLALMSIRGSISKPSQHIRNRILLRML